MQKHNVYKLIIIILIIVINIGCDQITKKTAKENLQGKGTVRVLGTVVILTYVENDGAFLSLGSKLPPKVKTVLLMIIPGIVIVLATVYLFFNVNKIKRGQLVALGCLIGGGISNLYDRIAYDGSVIDFMNIGIGRLRTGIFNVADLSLMFGGIFLMITLLLESKKSPA